MTRFWDGRSDPTPRPAFAFGDAGKNPRLTLVNMYDSLHRNPLILFFLSWFVLFLGILSKSNVRVAFKSIFTLSSQHGVELMLKQAT